MQERADLHEEDEGAEGDEEEGVDVAQRRRLPCELLRDRERKVGRHVCRRTAEGWEGCSPPSWSGFGGSSLL